MLIKKKLFYLNHVQVLKNLGIRVMVLSQGKHSEPLLRFKLIPDRHPPFTSLTCYPT